MVSFIGGGNWSTRRKPPTCGKLLTIFIIYCIEYTLPWAGPELTTLVVIVYDGHSTSTNTRPVVRGQRPSSLNHWDPWQKKVLTRNNWWNSYCLIKRVFACGRSRNSNLNFNSTTVFPLYRSYVINNDTFWVICLQTAHAHWLICRFISLFRFW